MKKILLMLTSLGIIMPTSFNLIACNPPQQYEKNILQTFQINTNQTGPEILNNLHTFMQIRYNLKQDPSAVKIAKYEIWYNNKNINNDKTTTVTRDKIINIIIKLAPPDKTIQFDQQNLVQESFILGGTYKVNIKVTDVNKQDIKTVVLNDLKLAAHEEKTYAALNNEVEIVEAVRDAINQRLSITASNNDFILTNDQVPQDKQVPNMVVTFTVTATASSSLIQGSFTFSNTLLAREDISSVEINKMSIIPNPRLTYQALNQNPEILDAIIGTINNKLQITITTNDFVVTNDQEVKKKQAPSQKVHFTVKATESSNLIKGSSNFIVDLQKLDISLVTITKIGLIANPDANYQELNKNANLISEVIKAIQTIFSIIVTNDDFKITNNHDKSTDKQKPGEIVEFTVLANENSSLITSKFTFKITLLSKEISY
ncbi:spiralin repeat-containing protein [Spiroplasma melliferum]|uniref:Spiralin n=2 Tax=Spiroplasma melliferum TaxID=2134 RepID=A0AAI9T471_SPIME|nr:spiralin repeat-containing protein [Spiroplasma melliferum]KAI93064.1 hypothetical protein SPM_003625 [Spiroplasma melliferum KC3]QCO24021.1 hypothetical protein SRED_002501 [Spiroplasma melliferum]